MATQHDNATRLKLTDLSFVKVAKNQKRSFWHVPEAGHYPQDIQVGAAIAHEFLHYLTSRITAPDYNGIERHLLGDMVLSMIRENNELGVEHGKGVKIGFCYELMYQLEPLLMNAPSIR